MTAGNGQIERAGRKLSKLESDLEALRIEYREAQQQGARTVELRQIERRGREMSERIEKGEQWIKRHHGEKGNG